MPMFVTTQSYEKDQPTEYGLLLEMDERTGQIGRSLRVDTPVSLPGATGRLKSGLRGIAKRNDELYITTWNSIVVVDLETFQVSRTISHRWMSDLHGIYVNDDGIWVTSTLPDALILYTPDGEVINACWFSETDAYPEVKPVDKTLDWRLIGKGFRGFNFFHCNHVEVRGGTIYVTGRGGYTKNGRIFTLDRDEFLSGTGSGCAPKLLVAGLFGPHDGVHDQDGIWVTETSNSSIARIGLTGRVSARYRISGDQHQGPVLFEKIRSLVSSAQNWLGKPASKLNLWTRGLAISDDWLYVGQSTWANSDTSQARVVKIERTTGRTRKVFPIEVAGYPEARIFQLYVA
jgi:hypothetical protein